MLHMVASAKEIQVYKAQVSALPLNWRWPDYQRPRYMTYSNIHDDPKEEC